MGTRPGNTAPSLQNEPRSPALRDDAEDRMEAVRTPAWGAMTCGARRRARSQALKKGKTAVSTRAHEMVPFA